MDVPLRLKLFFCTHLGIFPAGDLVRGMQIGRSEPKQYMNIARVRIVQSKNRFS